MQRLLITGASGFLGSYWLANYAKHYHTTALINNNKTQHQVATINCNLTNETALQEALIQAAPNIIIHAAAVSSIANCQHQPQTSYAINVTASKIIAQYAAKHHAQLIFTSTDLVFDGTKDNYTETDNPKPINAYGAQKYQSEKAIVAAASNALIVRLALQVGDNSTSPVGVINDLRLAKNAHLFTDELRNPIHIQDTVAAIHFLIQQKAQGICHIGGIKNYTRFDLGLYVKEKYNLQHVTITPTTHEAMQITNRPKNVTMCIDKLKAIGFSPTLEL